MLMSYINLVEIIDFLSKRNDEKSIESLKECSELIAELLPKVDSLAL